MPDLSYQELIEPVARALLGEPNERLSKPDELRFGTHGSVAVDLTKGTFYDHESNYGGGVLDLVRIKSDSAKTNKDAAQWVNERFGCTYPKNLISEDEKLKSKSHEKNAISFEPKTPLSSTPSAPSTPPPAPLGPPVAVYDYRDEAGALVMQVLRFEPKTFRQRRPEGSGWNYSVKGVRKLPYRLPELLAAPTDASVFIVEGEKDADRLAALGLVATCNAGGAGKWGADHAQFLAGRAVVVLPDSDEAGANHAAIVRRSLRNIAKSVTVINLPGLPDKGDVSDWLAAGGTAQALQELVQQATVQAAPLAQAKEGKRNQADLVVEFIQERFHLLHDTNGETYAQDMATGELRRIGSRQFSDRVKSGFFALHGRGVRAQAWLEGRETAQAIARFEGQPQAVHIRAAGAAGVYWLDLCQPGNSRAVKICADGWEIVDKPPVFFVRTESMQPLPDPIHGGSIAPLWSIANVPEHLRPLVLAWLLESMRPDTDYPGLELVGEMGSGKSTTAEALRRLIDPNACNLRSAPKTQEDIFVSAGQNHVVSYENLSHLSAAMQDALCILTTGGGFSTRKFFTNDEEVTISVQRPWMLNGISAIATAQDLVERTISIECPVIQIRESSSEQWAQFESALPGMLGALYWLFAGALRELPGIHIAPQQRPRLLEFAKLGMAMTKAAGGSADGFLRQYQDLRVESVVRVLDASPVATALQAFIEDNPQGITASAGAILSRLDAYKLPGAGDAWPRTGKGMGDALRRAAPALRLLGIECKALTRNKSGIPWRIGRADTQANTTPDAEVVV